MNFKGEISGGNNWGIKWGGATVLSILEKKGVWSTDCRALGTRDRLIITDNDGRQETYLGQEINYYYQGFAAAARDGGVNSRVEMIYRIEAWNWGEFFIGEDLNWGENRFNTKQLSQIKVAKKWANRGFFFYDENKHKVK